MGSKEIQHISDYHSVSQNATYFPHNKKRQPASMPAINTLYTRQLQKPRAVKREHAVSVKH